MFFKDHSNVYHAAGLASFAWLEHGFGTRDSADWPDPWRLVMLKQTHSDDVHKIEGGRGYAGEGDALVTDRPGVLIGVRTADCVPILMVDAEHLAVAAVHAGWRGTSANIVRKAIARMSAEYGSDPAQLHAGIGPAIGECCYEVGPEVIAKVREWVPGVAARGKAHINLPEVNRLQLLAAGVPAQNIDFGAPCTKCGPAELHSYRRDGAKAGRMIAAIGIL